MDRVFTAALADCEEKGLAGSSIPSIASRAGVNKTSLYRRWPSTAGILEAALKRRSVELDSIGTAGSLREELSGLARRVAAFLESAHGKVAITLLAESGDPGLRNLAASAFEGRTEEGRRAVGRFFISQSGLPPGGDPSLLISTLTAALLYRKLVEGERFSESHIEGLVDLLLHGAQGGTIKDKQDEGTRKVFPSEWSVLED